MQTNKGNEGNQAILTQILLARHGFSLEEAYEIVQYEGNCLPRLYLLVTVGMVSGCSDLPSTSIQIHIKSIYFASNSRRMVATDDCDEILSDLEDMVKQVQHPVRGLFLRYFLLQMVKDKLRKLSTTQAAVRFLLQSFKEMVILWQRLRLGHKASQPLDDHRFSLRHLLGAHLMEIARQADSVEVYAEAAEDLIRDIITCDIDHENGDEFDVKSPLFRGNTCFEADFGALYKR